MMNSCILNKRWVNDEWLYTEYRMSEWWIKCMLNIGWVNDEWSYTECRMSEWWMVVYWIDDVLRDVWENRLMGIINIWHLDHPLTISNPWSGNTNIYLHNFSFYFYSFTFPFTSCFYHVIFSFLVFLNPSNSSFKLNSFIFLLMSSPPFFSFWNMFYSIFDFFLLSIVHLLLLNIWLQMSSIEWLIEYLNTKITSSLFSPFSDRFIFS